MTNFIKPEVLAPAGDMQRLKAALEYGADAVYAGGKRFGMRSAPENFDEAELRTAKKLCEEKHAKLYIVCNTLPRNSELSQLPDFLRLCEEIGADGLIIADVGVMELAKKYAPNVPLHVSTQAGVVNYETARAFYSLGAKRAVLARELPLEEIAGIRENTPPQLELEVFAHGAMCMSFSGRCLLSNYMTGRDANRGDCAQPCRWEYYLTEKQRPGELFEIQQDKKGSFIFNSRDMCMIEHIPELVAAGASSLKIEGRAKSEYYVAAVTAAYRRAVDFFAENPGKALPEEIALETEKISHREYSTGFYFAGEPGQTTDSGGYIRKYELIAVCDGNENGLVRLKQRNRFFRGALADVLQPGGGSFTVPLDEIFNADREAIDCAPHAEMTVYLKTDREIKPGAYLRVKKQSAVAPKA